MSVKKIKLTFLGTGFSVTHLLPHPDDQAFAEALAVARQAGVIVVTRKDRDRPYYFEKRTRRSIGGIELNLRLRKVLK